MVCTGQIHLGQRVHHSCASLRPQSRSQTVVGRDTVDHPLRTTTRIPPSPVTHTYTYLGSSTSDEDFFLCFDRFRIPTDYVFIYLFIYTTHKRLTWFLVRYNRLLLKKQHKNYLLERSLSVNLDNGFRPDTPTTRVLPVVNKRSRREIPTSRETRHILPYERVKFRGLRNYVCPYNIERQTVVLFSVLHVA